MAEETQTTESKSDESFVELPFPNFYSNQIHVLSSVFDFSLTFVEQLDAETKTVKARVVMSPLQAKLLVRAILEQIKIYEGRFGKIMIPSPSAKAGDTTEEPSTEQQPPSSQSQNDAS